MITANVFTAKPENHYNLRNYDGFRLSFVKAVYHGTESISYLGQKYEILFLQNFKKSQSFNSFKKSISKWIPNNHPGRFYKRYVDGVGFL